jgi:hypothetical protein
VIFARETETNEITAFIVDKWCEGYSIFRTMGQDRPARRIADDVYMKDVRVPASNILGQVGQGYPILQLGISFGKIGVSSSSLAAFWLPMKKASNMPRKKPTAAHDCQIPIHSAESCRACHDFGIIPLVTYRLGYLANNFKNPFGLPKKPHDQDGGLRNSVKAARVAMDIHGSYGCMADYKISRLYKDAIIGPQIEGVEDMQKMIIAGVLLKG